MKIALTFDDGPTVPGTATLAYQLMAYGAKASFFLCGANVAANPTYPASLLAQGHQVGNHSWDHPDLTTLSYADACRQLERTSIEIGFRGQKIPRTWRPPYGQTTAALDAYAEDIGLRKVMWNVDPWWQAPANITGAYVAQHVLDHAADGAIVLLHEARQPVIDAMGTLLPALQSRGYQLVREEDLA